MLESRTTQSDPQDLYAEIRRIGALIRSERFEPVADELDARVASGSTGTEILMGVADTLRRFIGAAPGLTAEAERDTSALLRRVELLLR